MDAKKDIIRARMDSCHQDFKALLADLSETEYHRPSKNPGWTNGEILFHMTLGFMIIPRLMPLIRFFSRRPEGWSVRFARLLNGLTGPFNRVNALGTRMGGRAHAKEQIEARFERTLKSIYRLLERVQEDEWGLSMHYPTRWDSNFDPVMTMEKLFLFPIDHFRFHLDQIARDEKE